MTPSSQQIIDCYNRTARNYAGQFLDELPKKHLDRLLLRAFAEENKEGRMIDLGCGPGQTTAFLSACGTTDLLGTDLSPEMIAVAKEAHPQLYFETADMLRLPYPDRSFAAAIAFYAIVHFTPGEVATAFGEVARVLQDKGQFLFSFHIGRQTIHLDHFLDHEVQIDFHFFETSQITALLTEAGFELVDVVEREPYPEAEHPSRRAYVWGRRGR